LTADQAIRQIEIWIGVSPASANITM